MLAIFILPVFILSVRCSPYLRFLCVLAIQSSCIHCGCRLFTLPVFTLHFGYSLFMYLLCMLVVHSSRIYMRSIHSSCTYSPSWLVALPLFTVHVGYALFLAIRSSSINTACCLFTAPVFISHVRYSDPCIYLRVGYSPVLHLCTCWAVFTLPEFIYMLGIHSS